MVLTIGYLMLKRIMSKRLCWYTELSFKC